MLGECRVLRKSFGPVRENNGWCIGFNHLYKETNIVDYITDYNVFDGKGRASRVNEYC